MIIKDNLLHNVEDQDVVNGTVDIPDHIEIIDDWAFPLCSSLQSINIPDKVISIGKYAFKGCPGLQTVHIPNSVTNIGYWAFCGCLSLQEIWIPDSLSISKKWFNKYTNPDCIIHHGNKKYKVEDILHYY